MACFRRLILILFLAFLSQNVFAQSGNFSSEELAKAECIADLSPFLSVTYPVAGGYTPETPVVLHNCQTERTGPPGGNGTSYPKYYTCQLQMKVTRNSDNYVSYYTTSCDGTPPSSWSAWSPSSLANLASGYGSNYYRFLTSYNPCVGKAPYNTTTKSAPGNSLGSGPVCDGGCSALVASDYVGTYPNGHMSWYFVFDGTQCTNNPENSPVTPSFSQDKDADGKPDNVDICPDDPANSCNIPDRSKDTDADGKPDFEDPYPNDATNGKGTDTSGKTASGGGTCVSPPACAGDAIQCNMLYQQWATRCGATGPVGQSGTGSGTGSGDGTDVSGIENRLDTISDKMTDLFGGEAPEPGPGGDGDFSSLIGSKTFSPSDLDQSGFGFPRSCNFFDDYTINVGSSSFTIPLASSGICDIFTWSGYLVVALGAFVASLILIRGF